MLKTKMLFAIAILAWLALWLGSASAINEISVDPPVINAGGTTMITLTTERNATGTLTVTDPNGNSWVANNPINIPNPAGGSQSWVFPTDFPAGANTNTVGSYNVTADVTMTIGPIIWHTEFKVEFFVIPEVPFGVVMATIASFAAFGIIKRYKTRA